MSERHLTKFLELLIASLCGGIASWMLSIFYSTPPKNWVDSWTLGIIFVIELTVITAFLYFMVNWPDILGRRKKKKTDEKVGLEASGSVRLTKTINGVQFIIDKNLGDDYEITTVGGKIVIKAKKGEVILEETKPKTEDKKKPFEKEKE